jgi:hypothetical protein
MLHFYSKILGKTISNRGSPSKVSPRARLPRARAGPSVFEPPVHLPRPLAPSQRSSLLPHAARMPRPPGTPRRRGPCCYPPCPPPYRRGPWSARAALSRSHYHAPPIRVAAPSWTRRTPSPTAPHLPSPGTAAAAAAFTLASPRAATTAGYRALTAASPEQLPPRLPLPGRQRAARRSHLRPVQTLKSKPRAPLDPSPSFRGQDPR